MKTKPSDILQACADVFLKPGTHCKHHYAKSNTSAVNAISPEANKFCAIGAILGAARDLRASVEVAGIARMYVASVARCGGAIADWNDRRSTKQADVQAVFQKAADKARADGK